MAAAAAELLDDDDDAACFATWPLRVLGLVACVVGVLLVRSAAASSVGVVGESFGKQLFFRRRFGRVLVAASGCAALLVGVLVQLYSGGLRMVRRSSPWESVEGLFFFLRKIRFCGEALSVWHSKTVSGFCTKSLLIVGFVIIARKLRHLALGFFSLAARCIARPVCEGARAAFSRFDSKLLKGSPYVF